MIEKITDDKFLYQGRIVDLAFLQARKTELEEMIAQNEAAIKDIKFIELIPEIEAVPEYKEAAELFNKKEEDLKLSLGAEIRLLNYELEIIEIWL